MHRPKLGFLLSLALLAALALGACGGDSGGGDEDPAEVLSETFSNPDSIESGVFDLELKIAAEGGEDAGDVDLKLGGPFQGGGGGIPRFDVEADLSANTGQGDLSFSGGLVSTGDEAFVNFQGTDYSVPPGLFDQFAATYNRLQRRGEGEEGGNFLTRLGIDPTNWLTELENEGDEEVEGTETIHVSGRGDVPKLLADIQRIAKRAGSAGQRLTPEQLGEVEEAIRTAEVDVYSGADDRLLRRLSARLELEPTADASGAPDSVVIEFSLTLSEVNEDQEIEPPEEAEPLSELLDQLGIDPRELGGALRRGVGGGLPQAGGGAAPPSDGATQAYLECLQAAEGAEALEDCAKLIQ